MDVTELMKGPQPKGPRGGGNGAGPKGEMNITGDNISRHSKLATARVPDTPTQHDFGRVQSGGWCSSEMLTCDLGAEDRNVNLLHPENVTQKWDEQKSLRVVGANSTSPEPGLRAFVKTEQEDQGLVKAEVAFGRRKWKKKWHFVSTASPRRGMRSYSSVGF